MLLLLNTALAVDFSADQLMLGVGFETTTNDLFLVRRGIRQSIGWAVNDWVELGGSAAYYPLFGSSADYWSDGQFDGASDWTPLARQLDARNGVEPWLSRILFQGQLNVRIHLLKAPLSAAWTGGVGMFTGLGFIATQDDLRTTGDWWDEATATQNQIHGSSALGGFVQARTRWVGVRLRYESDVYIETIAGSTLEFKDNAMFGVELLCWL
jgi:hypothetical protein